MLLGCIPLPIYSGNITEGFLSRVTWSFHEKVIHSYRLSEGLSINPDEDDGKVAPEESGHLAVDEEQDVAHEEQKIHLQSCALCVCVPV